MPSWSGAATGSPISCGQTVCRRLDHYAIFMENNARYVECCGAGERAGLYYTCINSYPHAGGGGLHRRQQRVENPDHLAGQARRRAAGAGAVPASRSLSDRRRPGRRRQGCSISTRRRRISRHADRRRMRSAPRCSTRPARPAGRRASCGPLPEQPPAQPLPVFDFVDRICGASAKA